MPSQHTNLSDTKPYQAILENLTWLNKEVQLDPSLFAEDFLRDVADELSALVRRVADGEV